MWVDVLEQDRQSCYDAVKIAGSVLNPDMGYCRESLYQQLLNTTGPILY